MTSVRHQRLLICFNCEKESVTQPHIRYCSKECVDEAIKKRAKTKSYVEFRKQYHKERDARPEIRKRKNELQNKRLKVGRLARKPDCLTCGEKIDELNQRQYHFRCNPRNQEKGICRDCGVNKIGHGRRAYCEPCATDPEMVKERERLYGRRNYHKYKEEKYLRSAMSPGEALVRRLRTAVRGVVRRYLVEGEVRTYGCFRQLPYTPVEFIQHLSKDWPNGFPENITNYHIDHVIPVNHYKEKGELETMEGIMKCFALENLRLIPAFDNLSKGKKVI
jgi:hypothetical protein